jgi:hypothetical protein
MSWYLTDDAKKTVNDLADLEFYAVLPNGKRVPIDSLCKEYAKDPTGTVCKTYLDRLVLVIEAWWPEKEIWNGNWSSFSERYMEKPKLYWRQAFYLSTGTSNPIGVSYMELMRRNIWMPFNGLQLTNPSEQKKLKNELKWGEGGENSEYIYTPGTVVEFPYRDSLWLMKPFCMKDIFNTGIFGNDATVKLKKLFTGYTLSEEDLKKATNLFDTFDPFLPEGYYYQSRKDHVSDRFKSISYILASIALGGESYEKGLHLRDDTINSFFFGSDFPRHLIPVGMQRNPLKECFKHPEELPPTSLFDLNTYIARNRATQVDNLFRSINVDVDFDILRDSSVMIDSISRPMPVTDLFRACAKRVSKAFLLFRLEKIGKEDIPRILAEPLVDFLEKSTFSPANNVRFTYKLRNGNKNFIPIGGRKKTRNLRKRSKRTRRSH